MKDHQLHTRGGNRQDWRSAGKAFIHDPHRRCKSLVEAAGIRRGAKIIAQAKLDVHYVPGEHDLLDEEAKLYREREADLKNGVYYIRRVHKPRISQFVIERYGQ